MKTGRKQNFEESQKLIEGLKELGLTDLKAERMERLLSSRPTPDEKIRWIQCGVLNAAGDKILIGDDVNDDNFSVEICLWDAVYEGAIVKTKDGYMKSGVQGA